MMSSHPVDAFELRVLGFRSRAVSELMDRPPKAPTAAAERCREQRPARLLGGLTGLGGRRPGSAGGGSRNAPNGYRHLLARCTAVCNSVMSPLATRPGRMPCSCTGTVQAMAAGPVTRMEEDAAAHFVAPPAVLLTPSAVRQPVH